MRHPLYPLTLLRFLRQSNTSLAQREEMMFALACAMGTRLTEEEVRSVVQVVTAAFGVPMLADEGCECAEECCENVQDMEAR